MQGELYAQAADPAPEISAGEIDRFQHKAFKIFDDWAVWREKSDDKPRNLNKESAGIYQAVWTSWLRFLCGRKRLWTEATGEDVVKFVNGMRPRADSGPKKDGDRSNGREKATSAQAIAQTRQGATRLPSDVSKKRYSRILKEVYSHAITHDLLQTNPVPEDSKELPDSEKADSVLLNSTWRAELHRRLPGGNDPASRRDRAMLAVMLRQGLTCGEVMGLSMASLDFGGQWVEFPAMQTHVWSGAPKPELVRTASERPDRGEQARVLALDEVTARALQEWLQVRGLFRTARKCDRLFLSRRGQGALTARAVFYVASTWVTESLEQMGVGSVVHAGPNVLRNACIADWLETIDDFEEVRRRAGLKRVDSLMRIIKLAHPSVLVRYHAYVRVREAQSLQTGTAREGKQESAMIENLACG